jgi:hypothetical protein
MLHLRDLRKENSYGRRRCQAEGIGQSAIKNLKSKITIGGSYDDEN